LLEKLNKELNKKKGGNGVPKQKKDSNSKKTSNNEVSKCFGCNIDKRLKRGHKRSRKTLMLLM